MKWSPSEVTVTVRHRCPTFAFGSALGPGAITSWWWSDMSSARLLLLPGTDIRAALEIEAAVTREIAGMTDYRRHLDELAELP